MHTLPERMTRLRAVWPWREAPALEVLRAQLAAQGGVAPADPEGRLWFQPPDAPAAVSIRVERTEAPRREAHPGMADASALERRRLARSRWHVVLEHALDARDPTLSYHRLLQLAVALSPDLPALYDPASLVLRPGSVVRRMAARRVPPPAQALFRIHAVLPDAVLPDAVLPDAGPGADDAREAAAWLHTHGLQRAGLPELELQRVPTLRLEPAFELVGAVVGILLEHPRRLEDTGFEVVRGHGLAFRALEDLGPACVPPLGSPERGRWHGGERGVLLEPGNDGGPPLACLEAIARGAPLRGTGAREAKRMGERARDAWAEFGMAFAQHRGDANYAFLVRLAYPVDHGPSDEHEHLWFEVEAIAPGRVRARLLDAPVAIARMTVGDVRWHALDALSDWAVHGPDRTRRPHEA